VLRDRVRDLAHEAQAVLRPGVAALDLSALDRVFTLRANEGFVETVAVDLVNAVTAAAPGVRLRFAPKPDKDVRSLRDGLADLEIGVLGETGPEVRIQALYQDHFIGAVRTGHPLTAAPVTPERYAGCDHVVTSRRGQFAGPVDEALAALGLSRRVIVGVPSFPSALALARSSDLVALVPASFVAMEQRRLAGQGRNEIASFPLPVQTRPITVSQMWHPRMDADPAHRWLRGLVRDICRR
jgi:DNA-binding transcriptional LysR family regulator